MKLKLLFVFLILISIQSFAQDKKWSVEANYPVSIGDPLGNDNPGIFDLGIKYRFLDFNVVKIGLGLNVGVFHDRIRAFDNPTGGVESYNFTETNSLVQPKVFAEFQIPGISQLKPSVGLGYSIISSTFDGRLENDTLANTSSDGGLSMNIGLSYDLTKNFFIQAQYDYIRSKSTYEYESNTVESKQNLGFLKLGIGFRF